MRRWLITLWEDFKWNWHEAGPIDKIFGAIMMILLLALIVVAIIGWVSSIIK